ncbi:hypothetical protein RR46_12511 [Papilio xuthus]|uniref:Uncharacterized protein n=1 Tax=Papilio xuthus TaxID=66420 RepID=A0A194PSS4_PAPXU|nr:hypothetical protein RR46_12511 [Papilio xuthus]
MAEQIYKGKLRKAALKDFERCHGNDSKTPTRPG